MLDIRAWAPDLISRDDDSLVQQIRTRVLPRRGVWAAADEVVVTVGAQHALYLVADLLVREAIRSEWRSPATRCAQHLRQPHPPTAAAGSRFGRAVAR